MVAGSLIIPNDTSDFFLGFSGLSTVATGSFATRDTGTRGVTIDSAGNLISCDISDDYIYFHDGLSPILTGSFASPNSIPAGLAIVAGNLQLAGQSLDHIYAFEGLTSTLTGSFSPGHDIDGLTSFENNLYHAYQVGDNNIWVYKHDGATSTYLGSINLTETSDISQSCGIFFLENGNLLYLADSNTSSTENYVIYEYDGFSDSLLDSTTYGFNGQQFRDLAILFPEVEEAVTSPLFITDGLNWSIIQT